MLLRLARPLSCLALAACGSNSDSLVCRGRPEVDPPTETFAFPGAAVPAGDLNGDGIADLVLPDFDFVGEEDTTLARVLLGPIDESSEPVATIVAPEEHHWSPVVAAGDTDGDGADELAVVVAAEDGYGTATVVHVVRGPFAGDVDAFSAPVEFEVVRSDPYAGLRVVPAGDVNGDGFGDLLLASEIAYDNTVSITTGPTFETQHLITDASVELGGLAGVGDQDGDGMDDIAFGLYRETRGAWGYMADAWGQVVVVSHPDRVTVDASTLPSSESEDVRVLTGAGATTFGWLVAGGRDLTGDGVTDLVVAAPAAERESDPDGDRGAILVYSDSDEPVATLVRPARAGTRMYGGGYGVGAAFSLVGDTNGDGFEDIVVSGGGGIDDPPPGTGTTDGTPSTWLVHGPFEDTRPLCETRYTDGMSLEGLGDATGDGLGDLLFGGMFFARGGQ